MVFGIEYREKMDEDLFIFLSIYLFIVVKAVPMPVASLSTD
jgi:hypothetical protein